MIPAEEALVRLHQGNRRFVSDTRRLDKMSPRRRSETSASQEPIAVILGCSDSRVPAEIVFDQGFGELFVIRVAGNIVAPSQAGSVEFAVEQFGTRLVVVLGHTRCGAVLATLEEFRRPSEDRSENLGAIIDRIRPSIEGLLEGETVQDTDTLVQLAVRANIRAAANQLRQGSQVLGRLIRKDGLLVVGAEYSLDTGLVDFFDGVSPESSAAAAGRAIP